MAKFPTFPNLYNQALQIQISKLKEWGYIKPQQIKSGTIDWSKNGKLLGSISIKANTLIKNPYIELEYKYKSEPRNYKVFLTSITSNLKKGKIWYFICPQTKKLCRNLYSIEGYFLHREAFKNSMYEAQTLSKKDRLFFELLNFSFFSEDLYIELHKKNFKKMYAGKPTKKYLRIMNQIQKAEKTPQSKLEKALLS